MPAAYSYRDAPTLRDFNASNAFIRGLVGPLGGGKSSACVMETAERGVMQRPGLDGVRRSRFAVIRNSYRQLEDSTINTFFQWFSPHIHGDWKPSTHTYIIRSLKAAKNEPSAEIEVRFRALDRPDQIGNLLSTEYTGAWVNEGRDVPWTVYEALIGRVGRYPPIRENGGPSWFGIFADTNPPDTDSKWYRFFEEEDHSEAIATLNAAIKRLGLKTEPYTVETYVRCFKQPSGIGPSAENLPNLPPLYYERQIVGKSEDWIKVYLRGEYGFTLDGKPVFPEYNDTRHCPEDPKLWPVSDPTLPIYRSYDFGLTPACVFGQITSAGRWIVFDEIVATDMGFDQFSDDVLEHSNRHYRGADFIDIGDPAGNQRSQADEKTCFQIAWAKGIQMQAAPQTLQIRLEGTRKPMRVDIAKKPQFVLHPRCKKLRKAFLGGYHYRRMNVSEERYMDVPCKNEHSHVADACTYQGAWLFGPELRTPKQIGDQARADAGMMDRTRSLVTGY